MPEAVTSEDVERTITSFTNLDASGDQVAMTKLAQRLGREQPPLLQYAARSRTDHGDTVGEAAVFYGTLVWAMFERAHGKRLPRLTVENLEAADKIVRDALGAVEGVGDKPIHERFSPDLATRQPHVYAKLRELIEEDVREQAMAEETAAIIYTPTQVIVEAFDAAVSGRRPGERLGPVVNTQPKIGRNDPCPCGSGNKYKKCHGAPTQA